MFYCKWYPCIDWDKMWDKIVKNKEYLIRTVTLRVSKGFRLHGSSFLPLLYLRRLTAFFVEAKNYIPCLSFHPGKCSETTNICIIMTIRQKEMIIPSPMTQTLHQQNIPESEK